MLGAQPVLLAAMSFTIFAGFVCLQEGNKIIDMMSLAEFTVTFGVPALLEIATC